VKKFLLTIWHLPRNILVGLIWIYQKTISPDHSWVKQFFPHGYCRFHPTCSEYGKKSLQKYGVIRGIPKTIWRILRCNPWNPGGVDEP
jgi:hypothetical protein